MNGELIYTWAEMAVDMNNSMKWIKSIDMEFTNGRVSFYLAFK